LEETGRTGTDNNYVCLNGHVGSVPHEQGQVE
jgi:hypothetical protein